MTQIQQELLIFVAIPIAYSIGLFGWCYLGEKMPVFSKRNARSPSSVIGSHAAVLLILILLAQVAIQIYPSLPGWLTDPLIHARGASSSVFDWTCIIAVLLIGRAEMKWIYIESGMGQSEAEIDRS
jgi:hypothetical protein